MADKKKKGGKVSFRSENAIDSGLFSSGPATIKESIFAKYSYGGNAKPTPVWLLTFSREGEEDYEQPYSVGKGWKVSDDGSELLAQAGQTGLPKSCNAIKYLVGPLEEALEAFDLDPDDYINGDPSALEGLEVVVKRVPQEKREGLRKKDDDKERSILVIEEITGTADDDGGKKKAKKKSKDSDDDDEDEDEDTPKKKGKGKSRDDDDDDDSDSDGDDDEDEAPKKGKKSSKKSKDEDEDDDEDDDDDSEDEDDDKPKGKSKGKGKSKSKDDDDEDENELDEEATEALVGALEAEEGPIKMKDLSAAVLDALKGNPQRKAIAARVCEEEFLEKETSWSFNGKQVEAS